MAPETTISFCRGLNVANPLWQGVIQEPLTISISQHLAYTELIQNASPLEREYYLAAARSFTALRHSQDPVVLEYYMFHKRRAQLVASANKACRSLSQLLEGSLKTVTHTNYTSYIHFWNVQFIIRKEYFELSDGDEVFVQGFIDDTPRDDCFCLEASLEDPAKRFRLQVTRTIPRGETTSKFIQGGGPAMVGKVNKMINRIEEVGASAGSEGLGAGNDELFGLLLPEV